LRGLRLYVRPIDSADSSAVSAFLAHHDSDAPPIDFAQHKPFDSAQRKPPAWGLLGKLLGDIVAVVALEITDDALLISDIVVARELRRKWIGRAMLREVEQLAAKFDRRRVIVDDVRDASEFFRRVGFDREGERWAKNV